MDHPAAIFPYYLLATGATMIARTPLTLGVGLAVVILRLRGRVEPVVRMLDEIDPETGTLTPAQQDAIAGLVTPGVAVVVLLALLATVLLYVICRGAASAGTIHAVFAPLDDRDPLVAGTSGIRRDWLPFVAISAARSTVYLLGGLGVVLGIGLSATVIGLVIGIPLVLFSLAVLLCGHLLLAFAGQAVAVDGRRTTGALADSVRFPVRAPMAFLLYVAVGVVVVVGFVITVTLMEVAGTPRVAGLLTALAIAPAIDAVKTGLYAGEVGAIRSSQQGPPTDRHVESPVPRADDEPAADGSGASADGRFGIASRLLAGQRHGLAALATFVRTYPLANLAGLVLFLGGAGLGWLLTGPYGTRLDAPADVAGVFGSFTIGPFVNIAANNWQVAAGQGFGGIAVGAPTIANLLFNGVLVGGLAGVFEPRAFLALVAPHGIVEVPALAISGGVGLHLGAVGYQWVRGRIDDAAVGRTLQRAAWVLVGLLPVFVLAAFVEAFLTPRIAAMVLG